ncbi:Bifunctional protein MdtA [Rubripirellula obstinata]|uniref:Bifunctional protein MdtA n=1 Tax=Rubripirellula obstinata TaxID=406547 RepID=A0A5B1CRH7_9BACT|nr:NAD(P)-dependent methylenetetrahydromethanopterin dehydrogenase [Rubripirellula obstinata]KAA1262575.1 Bifunctional protein MdtA [Rubripirellula obstinata]
MQRILFQFDTDDQPSSFDSVVAIDAGVDQLLRYQNVGASSVAGLVHGAMFTRGGNDLANTAIFIGGSSVDDAEDLMRVCQKTFFANVRVSLMMDAGGCNTTASAAVVAAGRHVDLSGTSAVVLAGTGPVGRRVAWLLATEGASVTITSRSLTRAKKAADEINQSVGNQQVVGRELANDDDADQITADADLIISCGAAGVELIDENTIAKLTDLKVAIDLNAVAPAGIASIKVTDKAAPIGKAGAIGYGAIGVGGLKMKTHRRAIKSLFESNDKVLDVAEIYAIAKEIEQSSATS